MPANPASRKRDYDNLERAPGADPRSFRQRFLDLLNAVFVMAVYMIRILFHAVFRPKVSRYPPLPTHTQHPDLVLFVSGLGGPAFIWRPVIRDLRAWYPAVSGRCSIRVASNVMALRRPAQHERAQHTLPFLEAHCRRWGSRARLVLFGHSLGGVDVVWLGNAVRERLGGRVPTLTVAVCGAFGTDIAPLLGPLGVHPSLQEALHCRRGTFMQDLIGRARSLPHHPRSEQLFVMSRDDRTIVPPTNSLVHGLPGRVNRHIVLSGSGHMGTVSASSPVCVRAVARFLACKLAGVREKKIDA